MVKDASTPAHYTPDGAGATHRRRRDLPCQLMIYEQETRGCGAGHGETHVGVARPSGRWGLVDKACACVLARFFYAGGMRQSIVVKSFMIIVAGMAVVGGAAFVGFRYASDVRGDAEPVTLSETYTHAEPGFSFRYPRGFRAHEIPQAEDSTLLLVEDPTRERQGFEVFTQPYDEAGPITVERIRQDLPNKVMEDVHPVQVAGADGLALTSDEAGVGRVAEVWMVHDGVLYEITTYPELAHLLGQVLSTWTFE